MILIHFEYGNLTKLFATFFLAKIWSDKILGKVIFKDFLI